MGISTLRVARVLKCYPSLRGLFAMCSSTEHAYVMCIDPPCKVINLIDSPPLSDKRTLIIASHPSKKWKENNMNDHDVLLITDCLQKKKCFGNFLT